MMETLPSETPPSSSATSITVAANEPHQRKESVRVPCAHCGLPTRARADQDPETVFCCNGCRGVYQLIHQWGLDSFYDLRTEGNSQPVLDSPNSTWDVFDSDEFLGPSSPVLQPDGLMRTELAVVGLHCAACAWLIENAASRTQGWNSARVKLSDHTIRITFDPSQTSLSNIAQLMHRLGYELAPHLPDSKDGFEKQNRQLLIQIAFAGFCAANAMWIAIALYAGDHTGLASSHRNFLRIMGTGLGLASVLIPGRTFFVGALASLKTRTPHMDLPVALGLSVGSVAGLTNAILGRGEVYFDSLAVLVFLLMVGRWIQFHQQHRAAKSVDLLLRITPRHAFRVGTDGQLAQVLVDQLHVGDKIRIRAGESVPADGIVLRGHSLLDRSLLTGESESVPVQVGEAVEAGVVNVQSELDVEVKAIGRESRIGQVIQTVEDAAANRPPVVQLADKIGGIFVVTVIVLAVLTFTAWWHRGWQTAASNATSMLIVACPCALALATPLAIAVAMGRSARRKIFLRDGSVLGRLANAGKIWFDKTGTLTEGRPVATLVHGESRALALAAKLEQNCHHPIAKAILQEAERLGVEPDSDSGNDVGVNVVTEFGGIRGTCDGSQVFVGNLEYMKHHQIDPSEHFQNAAHQCLLEGRSPLMVAVDRQALAVLVIDDPVKETAPETIQQLQNSGWEVGILSGDHPNVVDRVAKQVGLDLARCHGGLSPEEKMTFVQSHRESPTRQPFPSTFGPARRCTTVMVGDGANDAPALAAADVGIAVRGGAEISLRTAPVFAACDEMTAIRALMTASKRTSMLINTTFATSLTYNLVAVGLAMTGHITPLIAAVLMPISSITVLTLCLAWPIYRENSA